MGKKIILESKEEAGKTVKRLAFAFKQSLTNSCWLFFTGVEFLQWSYANGENLVVQALFPGGSQAQPVVETEQFSND